MISLYRDSILLITWDSIPEAAYFLINAFPCIDQVDRFHVSAPCAAGSKIFSIKEFLDFSLDDVARKFMGGD